LYEAVLDRRRHRLHKSCPRPRRCIQKTTSVSPGHHGRFCAQCSSLDALRSPTETGPYGHCFTEPDLEPRIFLSHRSASQQSATRSVPRFHRDQLLHALHDTECWLGTGRSNGSSMPPIPPQPIGSSELYWVGALPSWIADGSREVLPLRDSVVCYREWSGDE